MPFSKHVKTVRTIDCSGATDSDRVRVILENDDFFVLRCRPELAIKLEAPRHMRLHLDPALTPVYVQNRLVNMAFQTLSRRLSLGREKKLNGGSFIRFFCWSDASGFWSGKMSEAEIVTWIQWPEKPLDYLDNAPLSLGAPIKSVEFFTV